MPLCRSHKAKGAQGALALSDLTQCWGGQGEDCWQSRSPRQAVSVERGRRLRRVRTEGLLRVEASCSRGCRLALRDRESHRRRCFCRIHVRLHVCLLPPPAHPSGHSLQSPLSETVCSGVVVKATRHEVRSHMQNESRRGRTCGLLVVVGLRISGRCTKHTKRKKRHRNQGWRA